MKNDIKKLSDYIDKLNEEKKPKEHGNASESPELEELFETVRMVRRVKEPALPKADYPKRLSRAVADMMQKKNNAKRPRRPWFMAAAAVAAVLVIAVALNFLVTFGRTNIVSAMEQAYNEIKAYHGILKVVEINDEGIEISQAKMEVWADKDGRYCIEETEGQQKGLITVNNGQKKWQLRPDDKKMYVFSPFPDLYRFTFEIGEEINIVKNALKVETIGEDVISERKAYVLKVTPSGGKPYKIWIDKDTSLPLQRETSMNNAIQYRVTYIDIEYIDSLPLEVITYKLPEGFKEINENAEQIVNNYDEASKITGFIPMEPVNSLEGYEMEYIAVTADAKKVKTYYSLKGQNKRIMFLQGKSAGELEPAPTSIKGKIGNNKAEIQSPLEADNGILSGGVYASTTNINSIRWIEGEFEYAAVGDVSMEKLSSFVKSFTGKDVQIPSETADSSEQPQVEVEVDLHAEENEQKSVDAGSSPWKLDPVYVAQVFVSLKISPEGIQGEYPVKYEDIEVIVNNGEDAVLQIDGNDTPIRKVYLKKLIRKDNTGIWSVVGYDPAN